MAYERLHLWGDSIAKGVVFDDTRGRYCITPGRCVPKLQDALGMSIINHARMGAIASEGLADFLQTQPDPGMPVAIEYGGNDCDMPWAAVSENPDGDYDARVPRDAFADTLRAFVKAVRERSMIPLLITPPPLDAQRYFDWVTNGLSKEAVLRFLGDVHHIYRWQERYANAVRKVAVELRCALFDMRDALLDDRHYPDKLCRDGIHLNAEGHALIAEAAVRERPSLSAQLQHTGT